MQCVVDPNDGNTYCAPGCLTGTCATGYTCGPQLDAVANQEDQVCYPATCATFSSTGGTTGASGTTSSSSGGSGTTAATGGSTSGISTSGGLGGGLGQSCTTSAECASACCAPQLNSSGNPVGPYICKPNDGAPYDCCFGVFTDCGSGYCCFSDSNNNQFCSAPCDGPDQCGAASCETYGNLHTTCSGDQGCGP